MPNASPSALWNRRFVRVVLPLSFLLGLAAFYYSYPFSGPANPEVARDLIKTIIPATWKVAEPLPELVEMTKEYFPDAKVQTLALVGPTVDHLRWTDHTGAVHVEDWSKECLFVWIIPSDFKPKFPNFFDHMAGGEVLPSQVFSSRNVCVYGYVTNDGFDVERFRALGKDITMFKVDGVDPSWIRWQQGIANCLSMKQPSLIR